MLTALQFQVIKGVTTGHTDGPSLRAFLDITGPAFYQLLTRMIETGLITSTKGPVTLYDVTPLGEDSLHITKEFYQ